jgi:mannose-6-phosphate isomerase-like protein (cupin superfamily)
MAMKKFIFTVLLSVFALFLVAQNTARSDSALTAIIVHRAEIDAAGEKGKGLAVADSVLRVVTIENKYNVGVSVVSRSQINGKTPPDAIIHDVVTEVYHIIEGEGILVVGGTLDSSVRIPANSSIVLTTTGPSSTAKHIIGGTQYQIGPGDIVIIPPHTPHGFLKLNSKTIVYSLIRFDPEKVLQLKN